MDRDIREFPTHLDPNNFDVSDFEDPYDAFYWFGALHPSNRDRLPHAARDAASPTVEPHGHAVPMCERAEYCAFDTETSGLSANDVAVQVAIGFFRADGTALGFYNKLWKLPGGVRMSASAVRVHKINASMLERDGVDARPELGTVHRMLQTMKRRKKSIVAHNASFDVRQLKQTAAKHGCGEWSIQTDDVFCTMLNSKSYCGLVSDKTGRPKAPSNSELYSTLTGELPHGPLHDAVFDIKLTGKSFFLGAQRGWWSIRPTNHHH